MTGTVIITGANSSLAIPSVKYLLSKYPQYSLVLTVRNTSSSDPNTQRLRDVISLFPSAHTRIISLDLSSLAAVQDFANEVKTDIDNGTLSPLAAIICNAYSWSISTGLKFTADGYESTIAVNHLAHLSLVLRLLGRFGPEGGKITFLGSDSHWPGKSGLEKFPPNLPNDLDLLIKPEPDAKGEEEGRGMQRYGLSKLAIIMGMHTLNKRLSQDTKLKNIRAVAMDPGGLTDSRTMMKDVPKLWTFMFKMILNPLRPVLQYAIPTLRSVNTAAIDLIEISVGEAYSSESGHFLMMKKEASSPESNDEEKQKLLWAKSLKWMHITQEDTALKYAFSRNV